ncbi:Alpha/Beta hydrolase protein [Naematelia encephala]|uniref:Alpha/Beta hydrolase protein n=1 Tax=Naematelia encephala TaxID=71784 RepID=A0A1Y2BA03_9TREE|nr:Alpha/Beta hydrolase protein [Naematelia encephala]
MGILSKAHRIPAALLGAYIGLLVLLAMPPVQRMLVYMHVFHWPLFAEFDKPQSYGLAPFKTRDMELTTPDGETLGVWHVLPSSVYHDAAEEFPPTSSFSDEVFDAAFRARPTIIYLHGNTASRAVSRRVRSYSAFSTYLDCNVVVIDYRGFADSTGKPTEGGLLIDARTAFDYVYERNGNRADQIVLIGQSLGTGVASGLSGLLADDGITPRALVLIAGFTSIRDILLTYKLFNVIPVLSPLRLIPSLHNFASKLLLHPFDSPAALSRTSLPVLLIHAADDPVIPNTHSTRIFELLRTSASPAREIQYDGWGVVRSYERQGKGEVVWWDGLTGGHDDVGWAEGTMDLIKRVAQIDQ